MGPPEASPVPASNRPRRCHCLRMARPTRDAGGPMWQSRSTTDRASSPGPPRHPRRAAPWRCRWRRRARQSGAGSCHPGCRDDSDDKRGEVNRITVPTSRTPAPSNPSSPSDTPSPRSTTSTARPRPDDRGGSRAGCRVSSCPMRAADARFIVTADDSGVMRFFALDAVDLIKQVCDRAPLEFTAAQWNEYLGPAIAADVCGRARPEDSAISSRCLCRCATVPAPDSS